MTKLPRAARTQLSRQHQELCSEQTPQLQPGSRPRSSSIPNLLALRDALTTQLGTFIFHLAILNSAV